MIVAEIHERKGRQTNTNSDKLMIGLQYHKSPTTAQTIAKNDETLVLVEGFIDFVLPCTKGRDKAI